MAPPPRLQHQIVDLLWAHGPMSIRDVVGRLAPPRAYTTVATVLSRLVERGRVTREEVDGTFVYTASDTWQEGVGRRMAALLEDAAGDPEPLLAAFLDEAEAIAPDILDTLQTLIDARRSS